jgi:hypothetical protein
MGEAKRRKQAAQRAQLMRNPKGAAQSTAERRAKSPAQWPSPAFRPILLIAPLTVATAGVADAQTFIGPGPLTSTQVVSGGTTTVVGNTTITVPGGDGIDAPPDAQPGPTLNINTEVTRQPPGILQRPPGPISITSGGTGVASVFPSSLATININSGPSGNVTITSGGAALALREAEVARVAQMVEQALGLLWRQCLRPLVQHGISYGLNNRRSA